MLLVGVGRSAPKATASAHLLVCLTAFCLRSPPFERACCARAQTARDVLGSYTPVLLALAPPALLLALAQWTLPPPPPEVATPQLRPTNGPTGAAGTAPHMCLPAATSSIALSSLVIDAEDSAVGETEAEQGAAAADADAAEAADTEELSIVAADGGDAAANGARRSRRALLSIAGAQGRNRRQGFVRCQDATDHDDVGDGDG